ncbi:MAG: mitochondrial fission ELM1 family protein [Beijerinckiaceae bacterium]
MQAKIGEQLPPGTRAWVVSDGKIGDEVQCFGLLEALGLEPERRVVAPRKLFAWAMPWGPIDPREARHRKESPVAGPWPDIVIAAGRRTVAYLRYVKRASHGAIFTIFVKDPCCRSHGADVIWVPAHDRLRGENVIATLTSPNRLAEQVIERARTHADPRIAELPYPRVAMLLGGTSNHYSFGANEERELTAIAGALARDGMSVMVTPSRRTPPGLVGAIDIALRSGVDLHRRFFVWTGDGENPYVAMLANADAIIVTADSVNMVGEAVTTGVPVHVYEPTGGHRKITAYIDSLVELGAVRRWRGRLENWSYSAINATPEIAAEVARRYHEFRDKID